MKAVLLLFDTLIKKYLPGFGDKVTHAPNFDRLARNTLVFDQFYSCSLPCMPARRELHTGRSNFLHRGWSPLEPFDDSVFARLQENGVYTHLVNDHYHYWEVGGTGYLNQYDSFEMIRGQQGDLWHPHVGEIEYEDVVTRRVGSQNFKHDYINRSYVKSTEDLPTAEVFRHGLDFIDRFHGEDDWLLMIESFSPHEPFFTTDEFLELYPTDYDGPLVDWPDYGEDHLSEAERLEMIRRYRAMVSMVDTCLGKVLDAFDKYGLWKDTALIVMTDHGFMLGEQGYMGKNFCAPYEEITHVPFYLYDPRHPRQGEVCEELAYTLNVTPTVADLFGIAPPSLCEEESLSCIYADGETLHEAVIFGVFGGPIGLADGRHVLYKAPLPDKEIFDYTLSPHHMRDSFSREELSRAELVEIELKDQGAWKMLKIPATPMPHFSEMDDLVYDVLEDPSQQVPLEDPDLAADLEAKLKVQLKKHRAPFEVYARYGLAE